MMIDGHHRRGYTAIHFMSKAKHLLLGLLGVSLFPLSATAAEPEPTTDVPALQDNRTQVTGPGGPTTRAPSVFQLDRELLDLTPDANVGRMLLKAPGIYVSRPEGDAVAHEVNLRGFDAKHGQDIAFTLGPIPLNAPSHVHGQGYADLNFLIPELVRTVRVTAGVYDPRQGDFAVAGSVDFDLGLEQRGVRAELGLGSFGAQRVLLLWGPDGEPEDTFAGVDLRSSTGFGENRGAASGSAMGRVAIELGERWRLVTFVSAAAARSNLAGILRRADIDAERVGFYDSYGAPTANAQSAGTSQARLAVQLTRRGEGGAQTELALWGLWSSFRLRSNYTGFVERSRTNPDWIGRGDLVEQFNSDNGVGAALSHRLSRWEPLPCVLVGLEVGLGLRHDRIEQTLNLLSAPQNETWDERVAAVVLATQLDAWLDSRLRLGSAFDLRAGLRVDALAYDVDDALGNFIPSFARESHIVGFRRNALGIAVGPRASATWHAADWLDVIAAYGRGYRSPQARQLEEGENAPFATVDSMETGVKLRSLDEGEVVSATLSAYRTVLSEDLAFDPGESRLERIGPTTRMGVATQVVLRPWTWALVSASLTYVHARLDAPPPATAEDPAPPYTAGELLPYVPPVVVRVDAGVNGAIEAWGKPLTGRLGLGFSYLSSRPLPFGARASPVALADVSGSLRWRDIEVGLDITNITDLRYAASEYSFVSDWQTEAIPSRVPSRHLAAGSPRSFTLRIGVTL